MIRWVALEDDGGEISVVSVVDVMVMVMSWALFLFGLFFSVKISESVISRTRYDIYLLSLN